MLVAWIRVVGVAMLLAAGVWAQTPGRQPAPVTAAKTPAPAQELVVDGKVVGRAVAPEPGDLCMLCNDATQSAALIVYLVSGQRVALHTGVCETSFRSNAAGWLRKLQPQGAFLAQASSLGLSNAWFYLGVYVFLGLVFGALSAQKALHKGCCALTWFALGFAFNVVAYAVLAARPRQEVVAPEGVPEGLAKVAATYQPRRCPQCAADNHPAAQQCLGCGAPLSPQVISDVSRARAQLPAP